MDEKLRCCRNQALEITHCCAPNVFQPLADKPQIASPFWNHQSHQDHEEMRTHAWTKGEGRGAKYLSVKTYEKYLYCSIAATRLDSTSVMKVEGEGLSYTPRYEPSTSSAGRCSGETNC